MEGPKNKGGGVCMFIHDSITYKKRSDLSINTADAESLCIEIINKKQKILLWQKCTLASDTKINFE